VITGMECMILVEKDRKKILCYHLCTFESKQIADKTSALHCTAVAWLLRLQ
jgi:hypothetical protein